MIVLWGMMFTRTSHGNRMMVRVTGGKIDEGGRGVGDEKKRVSGKIKRGERLFILRYLNAQILYSCMYIPCE